MYQAQGNEYEFDVERIGAEIKEQDRLLNGLKREEQLEEERRRRESKKVKEEAGGEDEGELEIRSGDIEIL